MLHCGSAAGSVKFFPARRFRRCLAGATRGKMLASLAIFVGPGCGVRTANSITVIGRYPMSKGQKPGDRACMATCTRMPVMRHLLTRSPGLWLFCSARLPAGELESSPMSSFFFSLPPRRDDGKSPTVDDLLVDAETLLLIGYTRASAMVGRVALERALAAKCRASEKWPTRADGTPINRPSVERLHKLLFDSNVIDQAEQSNIGQAANHGHQAAHGGEVRASRPSILSWSRRRLRRSLTPPLA